MYLKGIQIDLPYRVNKKNIERIMVEEKCSYEEAYKIDYDQNWKWQKRRRLELETRCIAAMFIRLLGRYKTKDCSKIVIDCVDEVKRKGYPCAMGICPVDYPLDYEEFFSKDDNEKKAHVFKIIKQSITSIGRAKEWDMEPIQEVFDKIQELEYNNYWTYGRKVKSPNKLYTAELYIEHEIKEINFYILIRDKKGEVVEKKLIITEKPSEWFYFRYFGKLSWLSDNEIQLSNKIWWNQWSVLS